jgi:hypothetical protein
LPHEITHVVLADRFNTKPMPRWADEGMAVLTEPVEKKQAHPTLIRNSFPSLAFARAYFVDKRQGHIPCYLGYISIEVDAHGQIYTGCWWFQPVGCLRERRLAEILGSETCRKQLEAMFRKDCPGCSCNYIDNIDLHAAISTPSPALTH